MERKERIRRNKVIKEIIEKFEKEEKKTLDEILEMLELMKESAKDEVVDLFDVRRVMEVMISEEIVADSLNLKEEHIKACKEDLEILEKKLESEEMEMMMNRYRTLIKYKVEDQKELEEIKRRQEEEIEAECEKMKERIEAEDEVEVEKAEQGDNI